jgi:hypothetical protein
MKYYVYTLSDNHKIFYIGKGSGDRMYRHLKKVKRGATTDNHHLDNKLQKMLRDGVQISYNKVYETGDEGLAYAHERELVAKVGLSNLCNIQAGGYGGNSPSQETRDKISASKKRKPLTEAHKQKLREAKLGIKQTQETKDKRSLSLKGKPQTDKQKASNHKRGLKGRKLTEEHKQKLRDAKLKNPTKYWLGKEIPEETKQKISTTLKGTEK